MEVGKTREREREKDKNEKKNSIWNPDRLCLGRSTGDPVLCLDNYSLLYVYYCILCISCTEYTSLLYFIYYCVHLFCVPPLYKVLMLFCCSYLFIPIPIIQYANHCTVRYGTSRRPHCPLQCSTPFSANGKPPKDDSAQEPTPSHGTGKPHRHGVPVVLCIQSTSYLLRSRSRSTTSLLRSRRRKSVEYESDNMANYDSRPFQLKPSTLPSSVSETA